MQAIPPDNLDAPATTILSEPALGVSMDLDVNDAVQVELPKPEQARQLHRLICEVKASGANEPSIAERFRTIIASLESDTVLHACTELPLIPVAARCKAVIDVTELVAIRLALAKVHGF